MVIFWQLWTRRNQLHVLKQDVPYLNIPKPISLYPSPHFYRLRRDLAQPEKPTPESNRFCKTHADYELPPADEKTVQYHLFVAQSHTALYSNLASDMGSLIACGAVLGKSIFHAKYE